MPARKVARDYDFLNVNRIKGLADPVDARDAVNLQYLQNALQSIPNQEDLLDPVEYVFLYNINTGQNIANQTSAGATAGDRVALAGQSNPAENGIYVVQSNGTLSRDTASAGLDNRLFVVLGAVAIDAKSSMSGNFLGYQTTDGTNYQVHVLVRDNEVYGYTTYIGNGTDNLFRVNHYLKTTAIVVKAYEVSTMGEVELGVKIQDTDTVYLEAYPAPGNNAIMVVIMGATSLS